MYLARSAPFTVRRACAGDVEAVRELLFATWHHAYDSILSAEEVERRCTECFKPWAIDYYIRENGGARFFVAEAEGRLAGLAQCKIGLLGCVHVSMLYVRPEFQRRGVGRTLLTCCAGAFPWARAMGLEVLAPNESAIAFYQHFGLVQSHVYRNSAKASVPIAYMYCKFASSADLWTAIRAYALLYFGWAQEGVASPHS